MTEHHDHDPGDRRFARELRMSAPEQFAAYRAFSDTAVGHTNGALPVKTQELIAVAVAMTTQCAYCLETHTAKARKAGVTKEELAEAVYATAALRAGGAAAHGMMAMRMFMDAGNQADAGHQAAVTSNGAAS